MRDEIVRGNENYSLMQVGGQKRQLICCMLLTSDKQ